MKKFLPLIALLLLFTGINTNRVQAQCTAENTAFSSGETLMYDLYYNWKFVWVKAGTASMNIRTQSMTESRPIKHNSSRAPLPVPTNSS